MFLIIVMNPDGDGARYWRSNDTRILTETPPGCAEITPPWPDIIAGILADWVGLPPVIGLTFKTGPLTCGCDTR